MRVSCKKHPTSRINLRCTALRSTFSASLSETWHSDGSPNRLSVKINRPYFAFFGADAAASFWKRGSFRSGSNIGSSRSSAGVSGPGGKAPAYGIESSFCKAAMARSGSPTCTATRVTISIETEPVRASFSKRIHGCFSSQSFWKAGSVRKGSQIGSSLRRAGVTGIWK